MEVGSEVYSMALTLQLQRIVSSPLTQELRISPAAALESMVPRTNWFNGGSSLSNYNDWNDSSTDVINPSQCIFSMLLLVRPPHPLLMCPYSRWRLQTSRICLAETSLTVFIVKGTTPFRSPPRHPHRPRCWILSFTIDTRPQ